MLSKKEIAKIKMDISKNESARLELEYKKEDIIENLDRVQGQIDVFIAREKELKSFLDEI